MKYLEKNRLLLLIAVVCALGVGGWALTGRPLPAYAQAADSHGHDHGEKAPEAELDDLFGDEDDRESHDGHRDHEGHEDHAEHKERDEHDEHEDHGEHAGHDAHRERDAHAGHDHDAHAGHDHGPGGACPEHRIPEAEDALCQPQLIAGLRPGEGLKVRLGAPEAAERIGVTANRPLPAGESGSALPGEVVFNRNRLARLTPLAPGVVKKMHVRLGDQVREGQVLAEIASPEIAALRADLTAAQSRSELAETVYRREKDLLTKGVTSRQEFEQAENEWRQARSAVTQARQQLLDYGVAATDLEQMSGSTLPVRAPFDGSVALIDTVAGEAVGPGTALMTLTDLSQLWVDLSVPEDRLLEVRTGAHVSASFAALPGRAFSGEIFWIAPALDEKTRMLQVLARVDNSAGLLRKGMFGDVLLTENPGAEALAVPADALQSLDGIPYVFVELERDLYELRRVDAGRRNNGTVLIARGLTPEDRVVSAQGFALKSEILKSRLGASCADH